MLIVTSVAWDYVCCFHLAIIGFPNMVDTYILYVYFYSCFSFHLEFKISLLNLEMVDSSITSTHSASFFTHSHILSLKSKLGEIITLLATHDKCIFMAVKNSYNSSATLSATYCPDGNMNVVSGRVVL